MRASEQITPFDEAALYGATAVAVAAAVLAAGAGAGSARVGLIGAGLVCTGVFANWRTRDWELARRLTLGVGGAAAAAAFLRGLILWEIEAEASGIYRALGDVGLTMGVRMAVLAVALSFLLVSREMLPFSLVPALAMFGLVGARGAELVVTSCFAVFLPAGLAAVGQAMLLSGMPAGGGPRRPHWRLRRWRERHWITLGSLVAGIMVLAYLLFLPVVAYGTQYSWPLVMSLSSQGFRGSTARAPTSDAGRSYPIGRGPIALRDVPVLAVKGPPTELWRGEVFDLYTGTAWLKDNSRTSAALATGRAIDLSHFMFFEPGARLVTHTVRAEEDLPFVFYGPGQIRLVRMQDSIPPSTLDALRVDKYGCIWASDVALRRGTTYEVVSQPLSMGRSRGPTSARTLRSMVGELDETYLRIPLSSRRVADLARQVAGDADSSYNKLAALVTYLQQNCVYTLDAPAVPHGEDAADYFLFREKRGYCDLFATALAVMARAVGIPARLAVGYAVGPYDEERGEYIIRESDAHAWVEVHLLPWGWVSVDATPAGELPATPPLRLALLRLRFFLRDHPAVGTVLGSTSLIALILLVFLARRGAGRSLRARARRDSHAAVLWAYHQLCRLLRRRGWPRLPSQTPLEFLAAVESAAVAPPSGQRARLTVGCLQPLRALTHLFLQARYGPGPVAEETAHLALRRLEQVREALHGRGKHRSA